MSGIVDSVGLKVCYTRASPCFWSFTLLPGPYPAGRGFTRSPETPYNADPCWLGEAPSGCRLRMDPSWIQHGSSMDPAWIQHGRRLWAQALGAGSGRRFSAWIHHGSSMDASWTQALGAALNFIC